MDLLDTSYIRFRCKLVLSPMHLQPSSRTPQTIVYSRPCHTPMHEQAGDGEAGEEEEEKGGGRRREEMGWRKRSRSRSRSRSRRSR